MCLLYQLLMGRIKYYLLFLKTSEKAAINIRVVLAATLAHCQNYWSFFLLFFPILFFLLFIAIIAYSLSRSSISFLPFDFIESSLCLSFLYLLFYSFIYLFCLVKKKFISVSSLFFAYLLSLVYLDYQLLFIGYGIIW